MSRQHRILRRMEIAIAVVLLVAGLGVLILGADWLVKGASSIARSAGISALVVGLTVVSFGTSAPELFVNLYSAFSGVTDVAVGNIVGSNIANILLILGVTAAITPLAVQKSTVKWEIPFALLAAVLVFIFGNDTLFHFGTSDVLTRTDGMVLLGFFIVFMWYIFKTAKSGEVPQEREGEKRLSFWTALLFVGAGLVALVLGGKLLVDNAVILARVVGLSEAVIGLTVIALGTSLPELATSVVAALRKEVDIAVGNVVGSNIFNIFWILGLTSTIAPLPSPSGFMIDALVMVAATLALFLALFVGTRRQVDRWQGVIFVLAYIGYLTYLVI